MQFTTNYNLNKPDLADNFELNRQNQNMDIIDGEMKSLNDNKANRVQEDWITPTLLNGWTGSNGYAYRKNEFGQVEMRGYIRGETINNTSFYLPNGYRPSNAKKFICSGNSSTTALIQINPVEGVIVTSMGGTVAYLDQIKFYAGA